MALPRQEPAVGDYRGIDEVMRAFGKLLEATGGDFSLEIHDCIASLTRP